MKNRALKLIENLDIDNEMSCYMYYVKSAIEDNEPLDENVWLQVKDYCYQFGLLAKEIKAYRSSFELSK